MIKCKFENGNEASLRHVTVDVLLLKKEMGEEKLCLVRRAPHLSAPGKFALPGGYVNRDEVVKEAALREAQEETGYRAEYKQLFRINDNPNRGGEDRQNIDFVYICQAQDKVAEGDNESTEVRWFAFDELPPESEFAFDHFETVQLFLEYRRNPSMRLPIFEP